MKLIKLIGDIRLAAKTIIRFGRQHHATLSMIQGLYTRQPQHNKLITGIDTMIVIKPYGSLYQITRTDYICNTPQHEETWLAVYGWQSTGHLIELGGDRYCIFETISQSLYLEIPTSQGKSTIELFIKNF